MEWLAKCPYCGAPSSEALGRYEERREDMQIFTYFCKCGKTYEFRSVCYGGGGAWDWENNSPSPGGTQK